MNNSIQPLTSIDKFLDKATWDTIRIYKGTLTNEKVASFYLSLMDAIKSEIISSEAFAKQEITSIKLGFSSEFGVASPLLQYALINSGLAESDIKLDTNSYPATQLELNNSEKISRFLIKLAEIEVIENTINKYYEFFTTEASKIKEPTPNDIIELLIKANNIKACKKELAPQAQTEIEMIMSMSKQDVLKSKNYSKLLTPYMLNYCYNNQETTKYIDKSSAEALKIMIAIDLNINEDAIALYTDVNQLNKLETMLSASRCLTNDLEPFSSLTFKTIKQNNSNLEKVQGPILVKTAR